MKPILKSVGIILAIIFYVGLPILFIILVLTGKALLLVEKIYDIWVPPSNGCVILVCVVVFVPMLFLRKLREWGGLGLVYSSYIFGFNCWVFSFIVTSKTLGSFWLIIGMLFAGVGVIPLAFLGVIIQGIWTALGDLAFATGLFLAPRILGSYIVAKRSKSC